MKKTIKIGVGVIVIVVALAGLWMYHTHELYEKSYRSEYRYEITIDSDSALYNVTLLVPLPIIDGRSRIGDEIIAGHASKPDGWSCSIVETKHGKMLKISAEKIPPGVRKRISAVVDVGRDINTKNPIGSEPLLSPKYNLTLSTYDLPYPEGQSPPTCYEYESRIYADFESPTDAEVSIYIEAEGENSWWVYGWSGNSYRDRVGITFTGEQPGWHIASGKLVYGEGRYGWI